MWKKRTPEEIAEVERRTRRNWKCGAMLVGALAAADLTFLHSWRWAGHYPSPFVAWAEMPARLPIALPTGIIMGMLFYYFKPGQRRTMICPRCDRAKREDGVIRCACGEDFADIKTLKWVS